MYNCITGHECVFGWRPLSDILFQSRHGLRLWQGGLIARYAIGKLYDPRARRVAGLRPAHYISIAAPHLGCDGFSGPAQVGWHEPRARVRVKLRRVFSGCHVLVCH